MNVVIRNLPKDTSENEIQALLKEHGVPVTKVTLTNKGNAELCVAVVALDTNRAGADALVGMVDGKFWHGKTLAARTQNMFTGQGLNQP
ncbi:MAG TPA: RNA-binding protein [Gammaproteobacteria bacterium]|nr:RNA-binding protein [Gammaproteobacteria bacterium]